MTTVPHTTDTARAELIAGLRQLADFYERHPDMPLPRYPGFVHCVGADDDRTGELEMSTIGELLGTEVTQRGPGQSINTERMFAGLRYRAWYNLRDEMRQYDADQTFLDRWREAGRPELPTATPTLAEVAEAVLSS